MTELRSDTISAGVAHVSFYNPRADKNAAPRASIELRAFAFYS